VITDIDNTLYDWLAFFIPSFLAMVQEIQRISGLDTGSLKRSFRKVYQAHGTTEYAFAVEELDVLNSIDEGLSPEDRLRKYDSAVHAFRLTRKRNLKLYPGVRESLERLRQAGVIVVAHSDSMMSYVSRRLRQLDVDGLISAICAPRDHGIPPHLNATSVRRRSNEAVESRCMLLESSAGIRKPDPATLVPVFEAFGVPREESLYVGDSLSRDILLARRAQINGVWARYGSHRPSDLYKELLEITYWTEAEVAEEERLRKEIVEAPPEKIIESFDELLPHCGLATE
jgi:phosphoglycolate phosphatase